MTRLNDTVEFREFYGTQNHYALLPRTAITDGVKHLGDRYGCYWFLSEIASRQTGLPEHPFQVWRLDRIRAGSNAFRVSVTDGNKYVLLALDIPFSDFEAGEVEVWFVDGVILMPSEY